MRFQKLILLHIFFAVIFTFNNSSSQTKLKPGFDPQEYLLLLNVTAHQSDNALPDPEMPELKNCKRVYRSDTLGLNNRWDLFLRDDSVGIISIRGTIMAGNSWMEDFYAAMVPAEGSLIIDSNFVFNYKLADYPGASVHAGFLTGLAYLSNSIITQMNYYQAFGVKDYLIVGHSQGGAIAYLLTSYLYYLDKQRIPDIHFKTYCSAPPKPGNQAYSYDYDYIRRDGWSLRVYNTEDWVPQSPLSVQTTQDFAKSNPYSDEGLLTNKMGFIDKLIFEYMVGRLKGSLDEARSVVNEYFGKVVYDYGITKYLPDFPKPEYTGDVYYYPCGTPVVLMKQPGYEEYIRKTEPEIPMLFKNHMIPAYTYLLEKIYFNK